MSPHAFQLLRYCFSWELQLWDICMSQFAPWFNYPCFTLLNTIWSIQMFTAFEMLNEITWRKQKIHKIKNIYPIAFLFNCNKIVLKRHNIYIKHSIYPISINFIKCKLIKNFSSSYNAIKIDNKIKNSFHKIQSSL